MTLELRKFVAPEFIFGIDARKLVGQYADNLGTEKPLIITGKIVREQWWFKDITKSLDEVGIDYEIYDEVTINPKDFECHDGARLYEETGCNVIIAVGGGSVLDCAKGIGIIVANGGHISEYEGVDKILMPMPPLLCVPTTSGSAADVSQFAIITNTIERYKMAFASKMIVPDISLIDPIVTLTCDFDLTVDVGLDALSHAIEAYVSNASSVITDMHALSAIENLVKTLPKLTKNLDNIEYRAVIMHACLDAGLAFSNASLGLVHALAHPIGGRYELVHGELNGMLLEHVIEFNYEYAKERYDKIAEVIKFKGDFGGIVKGEKIIELVNEFIENIRPNKTLGKLGYSTTELHDLAKYVLNDPCIATNPREATAEDVVKLYEKIF